MATARGKSSSMSVSVRPYPVQHGKSAQRGWPFWRLLRGVVGGLLLGPMAFASNPDLPQDRALPPIIAAPESPSGTEAEGVPKPLSIIAFGTSLTANYDWPEALGRDLGACLARPLAVQTVAVPGQGSAWALEVGLAQLDAHIAATGPADLVLVEFAINDADLLDGVSLARSRSQHVALLTQVQDRLAPGGAILLMTTNPTEGLLRWLQRPRLEAYYQMYPELAAQAGAGLVDFTPRWRAAMSATERPLLRDGVHPYPETARSLMVPVLVNMIAKAVAGGTGCPNG